MPRRLTSRERVRLAIAHQEPDRVPIHDSPWGATLSRWRTEGMPEAKEAADLLDAGLDCLQPLEVKAGMDLRELKPKFGRDLALFGGIDVRLMEHPDPAKIEAEIREKFRVAKPGGGYLYHSDHSIPKDVSFERYQLVMRLVSEYGRYD